MSKSISLKNSNRIRVPRAVMRAFPNAQKLKDATSSIEVIVTPRDCGKGAKALKGGACAMARAVKRQHEVDGVFIALSRSYVLNGRTVTRYQTPPSVAREIVAFDRKAPFAPGNYYLSAITPAQRVGAKKASGGRKRYSVKRRVYTKTAHVRVLTA